MGAYEAGCVFGEINQGNLDAAWVLDTDDVTAFLDRRPLFHGHVLVVPRFHHRNLFEAPPEVAAQVFAETQRIAVAVKAAMDSDGIFVATNNGVSQSVDHLHVHVVPRRKKDGLRGFMWPRHKYETDDEAQAIAARIREALG